MLGIHFEEIFSLTALASFMPQSLPHGCPWCGLCLWEWEIEAWESGEQ